jgi:hypothetical protein
MLANAAQQFLPLRPGGNTSVLNEEGCPSAYLPFPLPVYLKGLKGKEKPEEVKGNSGHLPLLLLLLR